jgi:hypothetical protein
MPSSSLVSGAGAARRHRMLPTAAAVLWGLRGSLGLVPYVSSNTSSGAVLPA